MTEGGLEQTERVSGYCPAQRKCSHQIKPALWRVMCCLGEEAITWPNNRLVGNWLRTSIHRMSRTGQKRSASASKSPSRLDPCWTGLAKHPEMKALLWVSTSCPRDAIGGNSVRPQKGPPDSRSRGRPRLSLLPVSGHLNHS